MAQVDFFPVGSDLTVTLQGVRDPDDNLVDGTATVTGDLISLRGRVLKRGIVFTYQGSGGIFIGTVPSSVEYVSGDNYKLLITVTLSGGSKFVQSITRKAKSVEI